MSSKTEELEESLEVFKLCPHYKHHFNLERLFWFGFGVSVGITGGFYAFWILFFVYIAKMVSG